MYLSQAFSKHVTGASLRGDAYSLIMHGKYIAIKHDTREITDYTITFPLYSLTWLNILKINSSATSLWLVVGLLALDGYRADD